ncbi:hypothetical protein FOCC_FOCC004048 [Frankliniella occidentalis]|uniref:ATP-dependent DNA helicase pif1-like n=1 Tax=Frankliniella occidentalis TaxID=133901 RepID=A0A6J1T5I7_FRAOC|nr:ATP-dependent DNA helicase pif1-like [Frankliniella occidentalis]KAE8749142.1 hypothetical protein FOCC_FOCC004048 [Frankliniella occidentalis]
MHNTKRAELGTVTEAEGLHPVLYLAKNARIMLKSNLWTEKGLVNGAMGTIVDIVYEEDKNPPYEAPAIIIVRFDNYDGPYLDNDQKTFPITVLTKSWNVSGENMTRTQFPTVLCYACSIHQSQSLTLLEKVVLNIGPREMATGITHVGLSRVKSVTGLVLYPFTKNRLLSINKRRSLEQINQWVNNLSTMVLL